MKPYMKIALLVVMALFMTLTACTRQASKPPVATGTATGEAPFPFTTQGGVNNFGTQTAIAQNPQAAGNATFTPEVLTSTLTPGAAVPGSDQTGGGIGPTATPNASGGGIAPVPAVDTPVVAVPQTYVLQKGEWPICIARRYGLDIPSFFAANGFNMNSKPSAGATLKIPTGTTWNPTYGSRSLKAHPVSYTVQAGESVYSIACSFGDVAPESIIAVNHFASASDLKSGSTIQIP